MNKFQKVWRTLGPGFLYAGAAVGVSHLVQSTKAGAQYGLLLIGVVVASNFLKYPFFEAGPRYAAATGESLISGYKRIGNWAVWLFAILTLSTSFIIQAAVTVVTAVLLNNLVGISWYAYATSAVLLLICGSVLTLGKYHLLDRVIKWVVVVLSITSIIAFFKATGIESNVSLWPEWKFSETSFVFLFALMGWMPAPVDIATWQSLWTVEKKQEVGRDFGIKEALRDFHIGYWGTAVLALIFLSLGALVLFSNGVDLSDSKSGAEFADRFIGMYTATLGEWTKPLIAVAAFATMFSTTITVLDGGPRVFGELGTVLTNRPELKTKIYRFSVMVLALGAFAIIWMFAGKQVMGTLVKVATITSFLTAPILSLLNYKLIFSKHMPKDQQPSPFSKGVAIVGLVFLFAFAIIYLIYLINKPTILGIAEWLD